MTIEVRGDGTIALLGACGGEEAEPLLAALLRNPAAQIDWTGCQQMHTALFQVMFAAGVTPAGRPGGDFLVEFIEPLFGRVARLSGRGGVTVDDAHVE